MQIAGVGVENARLRVQRRSHSLVGVPDYRDIVVGVQIAATLGVK